MKKASADRQIIINGEALTFRFSIRALAAMQDHWGLNNFQEVGKKLQSLEDSISADDMAAVLWSGLRTHHKEITFEDAIDMLDAMGLDQFQNVMIAALSAASSNEGGGDSAPARPPKSGR